MDQGQLRAFMAAIRQIESGGRYTAQGPQTKYGRATGAYQFIDSTWGNYKGYRRAMDAPPSIQDERAAQLMTQYYRQFGRWDLVAVAWHGGPGAAQKAARDPSYTQKISDGYNTTAAYTQKVMGAFTRPGMAGSFAGSPDLGVNLGVYNGGQDVTYTTADFLGGAGVQANTGGGDTGVGRKFKVPGDGVLMNTQFGQFLVFDLDGIRLFYRVDDSIDVSHLNPVPFYDKGYPGVNGGEASELETIARDYGSMGAYWKHMTDLYISDPEARKDRGIMEVYAQLIARPDMSQEELQARLRKTDYWNGRTEKQLAWNDLSDADKYASLADEASWVAQEYFRLTGQTIAVTDPQVAEWAQILAQGRASRLAVSETYIKPIATQDAESPWSRTVRSETENQRQRGIDIENQTLGVRELARRWGVQLSEDTLAQWGRDMIEKTKSQDDLMNYLKQTASVLYPWKDAEMETQQAAEPWLQAYERTMEKKADLLNPVVQQALTQGQSLFDFEVGLKRRPEWMETRNARDQLASAAGDIGRRMGFE